MDSLRADLSESNMIFFHSDLDDAGLSLAAFRLCCHLSRRGLYPTAESMAEVCRLDRKTVFRALRELENRGMLTRKARPGYSTEYTLHPPSMWLCAMTKKEGGEP